MLNTVRGHDVFIWGLSSLPILHNHILVKLLNMLSQIIGGRGWFLTS